MKPSRFFTVALLVNVFLLCPIAQGQVSRGPLDPFSGYFDCTFDDELKLIETIRLPKEAEKYRELETADGKKRVSRIDGYTLKYSYPGTSVFVNLKVEQSTPKDFEADKKHILDNTNLFS